MASFSGSYSKSRNNATSTDSVWGGQSPFLQDLYQRGADLINNPTFGQDELAQGYQQHINPQMNPYLQAMTGQYQQALGQLDNQTGAGAAQAGVFGGGRQGVEQYLNQQNIGNQLGNFLGNQYQADQSRSLDALSMAPQAQFGALQGYAGLIGGPTVLNRSKSKAVARAGSLSGSYMSK